MSRPQLSSWRADLALANTTSVGNFVVAALNHPDESFDKALRVQSFVVTPNEVLAEYERQTGTKWIVAKTPLDDMRKLEADAWETGHPKAALITLRRIWAEGGTLYDENDNTVIGVTPQDLDPLSVAVERALAGSRGDTSGRLSERDELGHHRKNVEPGTRR